jgi:C1A family cysteine protease
VAALLPTDNLPKEVNWVTAGAVNSVVKDHGKCASGWAISAAAAVESSVFLKTGFMNSFSVQQLVDCDNAG